MTLAYIKKKSLKVTLFPLLTFVFMTLSGFSFAQETEIVFLSGTDAANTVDWEFFCTDGRNSGEWTTIPVPSNWELHGFGTYNYGHDWREKDKKLGKEHGLYRYTFEAPKSWRNKKINIVFDGSMTDTKVKINGKQTGDTHQGSFYRFKYDITNLLKFGESNLLEVDVAKHSLNESVNRAERQGDYWIYGGIFRPVYLEALPEIHIKRVAIDAKSDGTFNMLVNLNDIQADYDVEVELYDLRGNVKSGDVFNKTHDGVSEILINGKFENIKAWNPEWPTLYKMKILLKKGSDLLHEVSERIGFRTIELRQHDGFYVNNEKIVFKGVNRHSFWPETGRALSEENHLTDIRLIKEMNMNAVRMSHYVPDKRFLELCDSIGLFVLNEFSGWQSPYDTIVGSKLIKETILKDENHPSVVIWDHGNERGWNFANEKWFHKYDIQKRPILYPILLRNGVDTHHYPEYEYGTGRFVNGDVPFMPTELLHGLYDGGLGAGLDEYWKKYQSSPLHAGGFLWTFVDEAVLRTDMDSLVFDADKNHANDGILGPHREKEASFYTVREIWSPVQIKPVVINKQWNGRLYLENKFIYTNLKECSFSWKAIKTGFGDYDTQVTSSGTLVGPDTKPGEVTAVHIKTGDALEHADLFLFTAFDHNGDELYTWSWSITQPYEKASELISYLSRDDNEILIQENNNIIKVMTPDMEVSFSQTDGTLVSVRNKKGDISLTGGPVPVGVESTVTDVEWYMNENGDFHLEITTDNYPQKMIWSLFKTGLLKLECSSPVAGSNLDYIGVSFNYPEKLVTGVKWMGRGPYRVWKNRIKGNNIGLWEKQYNNTVTGETFSNLVYPEFKGYHGNLYWATLETAESDFTMITETHNLYLRLFTPDPPKYVVGGINPPFPKGDISFLHEIPAIGTKFKEADILGPGSQKGFYRGQRDDEVFLLTIWFDFNIE